MCIALLACCNIGTQLSRTPPARSVRPLAALPGSPLPFASFYSFPLSPNEPAAHLPSTGVAGAVWLLWVAAFKVFDEMWAWKVLAEDEVAVIQPNTVAHLCYTPLSYAVSASSLKCVELLIKAGADVNAGRPVITPLIIAADRGFTCCIKCLLEAGADANIPDEFGRTAAQLAATKGWTGCVEILSPLTSPADTDDGLLDANDGCALKEQGDAFEEKDGFALKMQGDAASEENDYADALALYTKAIEIDPDDSTLYAKRSLCWLHTSEEDKALDVAYTYRTMKMDLSNSCYEQAAAPILVKEYARACRALVSALKLDLRSDDLD